MISLRAGNHRLFRLLFGWMIPPAVSFLKYTTTQEFRHLTFSKQVFQDIVLPMTELENALVRRHGPTRSSLCHSGTHSAPQSNSVAARTQG